MTKRLIFPLNSMSILALSLLCLLSSAVLSGEFPPNIIEGKHRSEKAKARNVYRNPTQTLSFFEVKPTHTVVEIWPGAGGWYTEVLAPYLRESGTLYAAHFNANSKVKFFRNSREKFLHKLQQHPAIYDSVKVTTLDPADQPPIAPDLSADRVLTFRNVHNWMKSGNADTAFRKFYAALKPGGILGVVEHRANEDFAIGEMVKSGYVTESHVKKLAKEVGFVFLGSSEINANPKDTKRHPKGVWTLPPSLRLGEKDKAHYLAIGESDRMTLKFLKPIATTTNN